MGQGARNAHAVFRYSHRDAALIALPFLAAAAHAVLLLAPPRAPFAFVAAFLVGLGIVYLSNTVAHVHMHTPLLHSRLGNRALSILLSAVTLIPQSIWTHRHMQHHAGRTPSFPRLSLSVAGDVSSVAATVALALLVRPDVLLFVLAPGVVVALVLSTVQGAMEHRGGSVAGVSHYGKLHNLLWFNDGYHAEHHARPASHWTTLPTMTARGDDVSRLSPLLRWAEGVPAAALTVLERAALASPRLQRWMVATHRSAFQALVGHTAARHIVIVGGGLFPRTLLALAPLFPGATFRVVERSRANAERAARFLEGACPHVEFVIESFRPGHADGADLVVFPLAFAGDEGLIRAARERSVLVAVHRWIWSSTSRTRVVSYLLLKRLSLVDP